MRVAHCVVWVSELAVCSSPGVAIDGKDRGASAGKKRRREHQQRAEEIEQPRPRLVDRQEKSERDHGAHQVARDHDAAAVQAVEQDAGDWTREHRRNGTRQHHPGDHQARAGLLHHQREYRDVVEEIAGLADQLAEPGIAIVPVLAEQRQEVSHRERRRNKLYAGAGHLTGHVLYKQVHAEERLGIALAPTVHLPLGAQEFHFGARREIRHDLVRAAVEFLRE